MLNKNFSSLVLVFGMTACLWSCGDDDDDTVGTGGSKATGGVRTGGAPGTTGGTAAGGRPNTGGTTPTGGTAGKATGGTATGGTAGGTATGGTATGGTVTGGTTQGGAGGDMAGAGGQPGGMGGTGPEGGVGGMGGGEGGMGGEGGAGVTLNAEQACTIICANQLTRTCVDQSTCASSCTGVLDVSIAAAEYSAFLSCAGQNLLPTDYVCTADALAPNRWSPAAATTCEDELCAWTCADLFGDEAVYARCGCQ
jgi:hypothetical protein